MKVSESLDSLKGNMEISKTSNSKRKCFLKVDKYFISFLQALILNSINYYTTYALQTLLRNGMMI